MRKLLWMAVAVALAALPLWAAERGGPGPGERPGVGDKQGGQDRQPGPPPGPPPGFPMGPPPGGPGGGMLDASGRTEIFDAARQTLTLPAATRKSIDQLDAQFGEGLQAAIAEARQKLSKEYVAKILALLPDEEKPKYEAVAKALAERDEALAAAQKELKAALGEVKTSQGVDKAPRAELRRRFGPPGGSQTSKVDILRTHFVLTEEQQQALGEAQRASFDAMRERTEGLFAGLREKGGPRDPNAFRQVGQAMARIREEIDDGVAKAAVEVLTDEQKKDYATACAAIDLFRKKTKEAEETCRKKIVEAVGEEKANALLGPPPGAIAEPKKATGF